MKTIHKYGPLAPGGTTVLKMPIGARVIHVGAQGPGLFVWATIDTDRRTVVSRAFIVVGTGFDLEEYVQPGIPHIASVVATPFVWHVYGAADEDDA